jgi:hypothetical protein
MADFAVLSLEEPEQYSFTASEARPEHASQLLSQQDASFRPPLQVKAEETTWNELCALGSDCDGNGKGKQDEDSRRSARVPLVGLAGRDDHGNTPVRIVPVPFNNEHPGKMSLEVIA